MSPSTTPEEVSSPDDDGSATDSPPPRILIVGGGMGGLVLALALRRHLPRDAAMIDVYEQAREFSEGAGGAIGMYPNGLRVLRDIDPNLLSAVREAGYPYLYRRWMRHDGTTVAVAEERHLTPSGREDDELAPVGIRRWRLQKVLYDACVEAGIPVHFDKRVERVETLEDDGSSVVECSFADGTSERCDLLFGADGVKSKVREFVVGGSSPTHEPEYTGVTCIMGAANDLPRPVRGICFPTSSTTKCHECTYPTGPDEQVFQIYFPTPVENPESWGTLDEEEGRKECSALAERLERDGWAEEFLAPLRRPESVVRVGLRTRDPLDEWIGGGGRVVLLGDAAHPAVPYIGQGAQMAIEDAGVLALLLGHYCCDGDDGGFTLDNVDEALRVYESMRIPRTREILGSSRALGATQQRRADSRWYNVAREWSIWWQVAVHGTLPVMKPGATYDYREDVERVLRAEAADKKGAGGISEETAGT